jgi:hypothetical protein
MGWTSAGYGSLTGATWPSPPAISIAEGGGGGPVFSPPHCTDAAESSTVSAAKPSLRDRSRDRVEVESILAGMYARVDARFGPHGDASYRCMSLLC